MVGSFIEVHMSCFLLRRVGRYLHKPYKLGEEYTYVTVQYPDCEPAQALQSVTYFIFILICVIVRCHSIHSVYSHLMCISIILHYQKTSHQTQRRNQVSNETLLTLSVKPLNVVCVCAYSEQLCLLCGLHTGAANLLHMMSSQSLL